MISKISRQLIIFHIFLYSNVVEFREITDLIKISRRTITRDLKQLQNAGLINVRFSKKEKRLLLYIQILLCGGIICKNV